MKQLIVLITAIFTLGHTPAEGVLTKKERKFASRYMEDSMSSLFKGIEKLSAEQWNFSPADGGWSIAGTCEHLLIAEKGFYGLITQRILSNEQFKQAPEQPVTDKEVIDFIKDRSPANRVQTAPGFVPKGILKSPSDFMQQYKTARKKLLDYIKESDDELKSYYFDSPAGKISAYQWLILASAHTERHFGQMKEVMAETGYPK